MVKKRDKRYRVKTGAGDGRERREYRLWIASLETHKGRGEAVLAELNKHDWREAE